MNRARASSLLKPSASARAAALLAWAAAAGSVVYWGLQLSRPPTLPATPLSAAATSPVADTSAHMAKALGQKPTQPAPASTAPVTSSQFKLWGVIASASGQGSALIATNGQPPKAYRVGQNLNDDWTLSALTPRQAQLKSANAEITLALPSVD